MKKIIGIVLLVVLAYTSFWSYKANQGKSYIEQQLKEAKIHSDKVSISGYPFYCTVSIENPTWVDPNQNVNVSSKGTLSLTSNFFGNKFWVSRDGEIHVKLDDDAELNSIILKGKSEFYIESKDGFNINHIFEEIPLEYSEDAFTILLDHLKGASLKGKDIVMEIENNAEKISFQFEDLDLRWERNFGDKTQTHRLNVVSKNAKFNRKPVDLSLISLEDVLSNAFNPDHSHFVFEGEMTIPNEKFTFFPIPEMSVKINKLESSSSVADSKAHMSFMTKKNEGHDEMHINFVMDGTTTETGYKEQIKKFLAGIKDLSNQKDEESKIFKDLLANHEDELVKLIPKLYLLSPVQLNIDIHAKDKKDLSGDMKINDFNINMGPYGFVSNGHFAYESMSVEGAYKIQMNHYKLMMQDLTDYINNWSKVLAKFYEDEQFEITQHQVDEMLKLMRQISDEPKVDSEDLHLTIKAEKDGTFTIGNEELSQAMGSLEMIFNPPEEKEPPASPEPVI